MYAFDALFAAAMAVRRNAYAPYSRFPVGAAVRGESGRVHAGCNVENAAYSEGQCAETGAIAALVAAGDRRLLEVLIIGGASGDGTVCTPCGGCRQRLGEFGAPDTVVYCCGPEGLRLTTTLGALLPHAFGPQSLGGQAPEGSRR